MKQFTLLFLSLFTFSSVAIASAIPGNQTHAISTQISTADACRIATDSISPVVPNDEVLASKQADDALWLGFLSIILTLSLFLSPIGFFIGLHAINKSRRALAKTQSRKTRRKAKWAIALGSIGMIGASVVIIWVLIQLSKLSTYDFGG